MTGTNQPQTPPSDVSRLRGDTHGNLIRQVARATMLSALGYVLYFGGVFLVSLMDSSVLMSETSWAWGSIVPFGLAASEFFALDSWLLNKNLLRRIILSVPVTIASLLIAEPMCGLFGIELREDRQPLFWPRVAMALPLFAFFTVVCRGMLQMDQKTHDV